ncbi:MAG: EamA family transporter [bacterium]|nr:EamA family transporter [bacterium]
MNRKNERYAPLYILAAGTCWGMIGLFSKKLYALGFSSPQITEGRSFVVAVCLLVFLLVRNRKLLVISWKDLWLFLGTGIVSIVFFNICYFYAIEEIGMTISSVLLYTAPFIVLVLSAVFFREKITKRKLMALCIAFVGCCFTVGLFSGTDGRISVFGILTGLGAGLGYAMYSIFGNQALKKYDTMTVTFYTFLIASISLLPFVHPGHMIQLAASNGTASGNLLLLGVVSTLTPFLLYTKGLNLMEPARASIMAFIEPMVANVIGITVFHEPVTICSVTGIVLIFVSVILLNMNERKRTKERTARSTKMCWAARSKQE